MTRIAVPLRNGLFCSHFGGAESFAFYDVSDDRAVAGRRVESPPEHGRGLYPMWLRQLGATTVLAGGMGPRASTILTHHGIEVMLGVEGDDPDALVESYLAGNLRSTGELCHDHDHHSNCGHHHGPDEGTGRGKVSR